MHVALEGRHLLPLAQHGGGGAKQGIAAGAHHQRPRLARLCDRATKQGIAGLARRGGGHHAGALFHGVGLAGQGGFTGSEGFAVQHQGIGGDDIARAHAHHIAGHNLLHRHLAKNAAPQHFGTQRHRTPQHLGRAGGPPFLHGIEPDRQAQNGHDDAAAHAVARGHRHRASAQQNQRQRLAQPPTNRHQQPPGLRRGIRVGPVLGQPSLRFSVGQARHRALQPVAQGLRRQRPESLRNSAGRRRHDRMVCRAGGSAQGARLASEDQPPRTSSTGTGDWRNTCSASLPSSIRPTPRRPWVPSTMSCAPHSRALAITRSLTRPE